MNKKRMVFVHSVIALLLCVSMLVGTTFAWFTDSVRSNNNMIVAGNLDVELEYMDASGNWKPVEGDTNVFAENTLWEPGHTEVVYLRVSNVGTLALKYQLGVNIAAEAGSVNVAGEPFVLSDYIEFAAIEDVQTKYADRAAARAAVTNSKILSTGYTKDGELLAGDPADYVAFVVYMPETVDNAANYRTGELPPRIELGISLLATQFTAENDSFGNNYDYEAGFPDADISINGKTDITVENGVTTSAATIQAGGVTVEAPAGVQVVDGAAELSASFNKLPTTGSNITAATNEDLLPLDVHVEGVAPTNTTPLKIRLEKFAPIGLNIGNLKLYHVENGETVAMTRVTTEAELIAHNQFTYDPVTGDVVLSMATFSEVTLVANTENAWKGNFDYKWYDASKTDFVIANADQLAAFGAIVGGMDGKTADSFKGKTVTLITNVNIGDMDSENSFMFYPIGYYNNTGSYVKQSGNVGPDGTAVVSGYRNFEGTFDGNGHTIQNFYQNTWEAFGDYNDGYSGTPNHSRDGFGLFGRVYCGTVKNLTVRNFQSDGEFATTGTIAAYADGATFKNISIFSCNPRVYNIGNGGIVGCVGWYAKDANLKTTFENITVDKTNKISALWGSWDVACGGILGQYYPTSGQTSAGTPKNGGVHFKNCHVAAQMDVYNDVCANYQYYAYRYAGILLGSVRENETINGYEYPKMEGITAEGCTVHFGDWNDYYYCELVANSLASYTHDHQMSRLTQVASVDVANMKVTYLDGTTGAIPTSGRQNYVVVKAKDANGMWIHGDGHDYAECYHFVNGVQHKHDVADSDNPEIYETVDGVQVLKEDKQCIYREFNNLVTGYGWGVTSKGVGDMDGVMILDREEGSSGAKFTGKGVTEIESETAVKIGDLFNYNNTEIELKTEALTVTITDLDDTDGIATATFTPDTTNWENGTLTVHGKGDIAITIQDYYFCEPTTIELLVRDEMQALTVDATTLYSIGQSLDIRGVTVSYKHGADAVVTADKCVVSNVNMDIAGKKVVTVSYTEYDMTVTQTITVTVSEEFSSLVAASKKETYRVGETPEFNVSAITPDGTKGAVTGYTVAGADTTSAGIKTVTISHGNKTTTCKIYVVNETVVSDHKLCWFNPNGFWLGSAQQYYMYANYVNAEFPGGANGEKALGFNNDFSGAENPGSYNGIVYYMGASQYDLKVTGALPYTTIGIACATSYDVRPLGFGYYIGDDMSTLKYSAPTYFADEVAAGNSEYQGFLNDYGPTGASANTKFTLTDFEPGKTYEVHWVVIFEDGIQPLSDWTVKMKAAGADDDYFVDTDKPDVNVIVLSGQSNASGATPFTQAEIDKYGSVNYQNVFMQYRNTYLAENDAVNIYTKNENRGFEKYYFGMGGFTENTYGPDAALAYYLATTPGLKDQQWFIIKYAAPGTNLDLHWQQNNNLTNAMIAYVKQCVDVLSEDYDVQLRSFLWMQGENDAMDQGCAERYAVNEQNLVAKFRAAFAAYDAIKPNYQIPGSGIAFISAGIAPAGKDGNIWTYSAIVNEAKVNNAYVWYGPGVITEQSPLYRKAEPGMTYNPNTAGIYNSAFIDTSLMSAQADDPAHYDQQSMEWLGTWFGEYVSTMININLPAPPPPTAATYTIFLDANGGTLSNNLVEVNVGATTTLPTPTMDGYAFQGWYTAAVGGEKVSNDYKPTADVMLYAQWTEATYTATVDSKPSSITVSPTTITAKAGDSVTITLSRSGYSYRATNYTVTVGDKTYSAQIASGSNKSTTVTFEMPAKNVSIKVTQN